MVNSDLVGAATGRSTTPDAYSFTTIKTDRYMERVIEEAKPGANFLIVTDKDGGLLPVLGAGLYVRISVLGLADQYPYLKLAGRTLEELREAAMDVERDWLQCTIFGHTDVVNRKLETIRQEIRAINNKLQGKTVKVTVESF